MAGSHHLIVFQEMQMTHSLALWYLCKPTCSVLTLDSVDPALGRGGKKWNRHLLDFPHSLLCLYPGWNPSGLFKRITQFAVFLRQRAPCLLWCPRLPQFSVSVGQKEAASKVCVTYLPRGFNGSYRETLRGKKSFFKKRWAFKIILTSAKNSNQDLYSQSVTRYSGLPFSYSAISFSW